LGKGTILLVVGGLAIGFMILTGTGGSLFSSLAGGLGSAADLFGLGAGTAAGSKILGSGKKDDKGSKSSGSGGGKSHPPDDFSDVTDPFGSPDLSKISPASPSDTSTWNNFF
jgi:hypothetical protein